MENIEDNQTPELTENEASLLIQTAFRQFIKKKRAKEQFSKIGELNTEKNIIDKIDEIEMKKEVENSTKSLREIPYNIWIIVFSFAEGWNEFKEYQKVCKLFRKISNFGTCWVTFMKCNEKEIVDFVKEKNNETNMRKINWKILLKDSKLETDQKLQNLNKNLLEIKEEGNKEFKDKKFIPALEKYRDGIEKSKEFDEIDKNPICKKFADRTIYLGILKMITILYSNAAQTCINSSKWLSAMEMGRSATKMIIKVKIFCSNIGIDFEENFGILEKKIKYRVQEARNRTMSLFRFARYSENPVDGVRVGTIITASDGISGDIFCKSKGVQGIIINKIIPVNEGRIIRIGGPCEMRTIKVLHNIENVPGAIRIMDGVYQGGDFEGIDKSQGKYREYMGYAAWFGGQLDGELRNHDWEFSNEHTADGIFTEEYEELDMGR